MDSFLIEPQTYKLMGEYNISILKYLLCETKLRNTLSIRKTSK